MPPISKEAGVGQRPCRRAGPYVPVPSSEASASGALRSRKPEREQRGTGLRGRLPILGVNGRRDRLRPRQGHGGGAAAARRLVQARAARPADPVGTQRLRQDDAAADAGGRGARSTAASSCSRRTSSSRCTTSARRATGDITLRDYVLSGARDLLELEERLAELELAMAAGDAGGATLDAYASAQARLEHAGGYELARGDQRHAARPRLPRPGSGPLAGDVSRAAS